MQRRSLCVRGPPLLLAFVNKSAEEFSILFQDNNVIGHPGWKLLRPTPGEKHVRNLERGVGGDFRCPRS